MNALLLLPLLVASATAERPDVFAVIVGNNASNGGELADLSFADDDAARYFELFSLTGGRVEILSVLDADTQLLHPQVASKARAPRRDELERALDTTFDAIRQARSAGRRTAFYFIYVGHGSVGADGEGQMHLLGGRFSRSDLFQRVVSRSPATVNHLIIDACNAYLMVARRGVDTSDEVALSRFLAREDLSAFPNTGVLVSTSEAAEVHEWSRFAAGIFSHEVRSALIGASDVDADGRATYDEVRAFIAAANARIENPRARLEIYAAAPRLNLREPIFDRAWVTSAITLQVPSKLSGRYYVEDGRGVRYADFHSSSEFDLTLTLVPRDLYFLRGEAFEMRIPAAVMRTVDAATLSQEPLTLAARGSESATFQRHLFALPFGPSYFEGYRASIASDAPSSRAFAVVDREGLSGRQIAGISVAGAGVASLFASLVLELSTSALRTDFERAVGSDADIDDLEDQVEDRALARDVLLGAGVGLLVTGATLVFWPN